MSDPDVVLRARTPADLDVLHTIAADLATWELRNPAPPAPLTRAAFEARLDRRDTDPADTTVEFVVDVDGTAVGRCSLFHVDHLARHAEVGISLAADARGKGIGTAALRRLVEFGFVRHNLRRLHLVTLASNPAAVRSYEKAGFVVEGRLREHCWVAGSYVDELRMGLLRADWAARRAQSAR